MSQKSKRSKKSSPSLKQISFKQIREEQNSKDEIKEKRKEAQKRKAVDIFEAYMTVLLGRELSDAQEELIENKAMMEFDDDLFPDAVITFPNPDFEDLRINQIDPLMAMEYIQKVVHHSTLEDHIFLNAVEAVFIKLKSTKLSDQESSHSISIERQVTFKSKRLLQTKNYDIPDKINSVLRSKRQTSIQSFTRLPQTDIIYKASQKLMQKLNEQNQGQEKKIIDCLVLDYGKLKKMNPRIMTGGAYFKKVDDQWLRTNQDTKDLLTLIRQVVLIVVAKAGFRTKLFFSKDGRQIFCALFQTETNLEQLAQKHELKKRLNFWFQDLFSLEPVDADLRPLRLNNRLWKPDDFLPSEMFQYLRPKIIELLERINYKRLSRETNQNRINQSLFQYGKTDFYGDDVEPKDDEWFAYYQYLMHIDMKLDELRAECKIDSDISALLNKQVNAFDLYKLRNRRDKEIQKFTRLTLPRDHLDNVLRIDETATRYAQRYKKFLTNPRLPLVKAIKILKKERFSIKLYDLFEEALKVVNVNQQILMNLWDRLKTEKLEPYVKYIKSSNSIPIDLQMQLSTCWCKYQVTETNKISVFSTTDRLKLTYLALNDCLSFTDLISRSYVQQLYCLHDHYELFGHCTDFDNVMEAKAQFYRKKLFQLISDWKLDYNQPWQIPVDLIISYYGEKIGLYFYYLSYFTQQLAPIGIIGLGCSIVQWIVWDNDAETYQLATMIFSFIQIQWTNLLCDLWQQKQALFNLQQGQSKKDARETQRATFSGYHVRSIQDDQLNSVQQSTEDLMKRLASSALVLILILTLYSGLMVGLFVLTISMQDEYSDQLAAVGFLQIQVSLSAVINIILITIFQYAYDWICTTLTDYENHQTIQDYESSFVMKKYILEFFSYVAPLLFIAFLNDPAKLYCYKSNCQLHVQYHFSVIMVFLVCFRTARFVKSMLDLRKIPIFRYSLSGDDIEEFIQEQSTRKNYAISQERYGTLEDYMDIFVQNTLLSLFGYTFPVSFFLVFIQNIAQLQADRTKFLFLLQRPWPQNEFSLGVWGSILKMISYVCLLSNSGNMTIIYARRYDSELILVFLCFLISNCMIKFVSEGVFGDVSYAIEQLIQRQRYIIKSTVEQFQKKKTSLNSSAAENLKRYTLHKVWNTLVDQLPGDLRTVSSDSDLEDRYLEFEDAPISDQLPLERLLQFYQKRPHHWAFKFLLLQTKEKQKKKIQLKYYRLMYKLQMLSFRKRVWTDQRLQLRAYYIKRKHQLIRNLDWRKLIIIRKNQVTMDEYWQQKAENKYRKLIDELEGATRQDDIQEYNELVRKRNKYMDKHKWINCTKFVALKVKAVWFSGFRKSTHKQPALKTVLEFYARIQKIEKLKPDQSLQSRYLQLVDVKKINSYDLEKFVEVIANLENPKQVQKIIEIPITARLVSPLNFMMISKTSPTMRSFANQFKDTFIFENQNQMLQEITMQYFQESLFENPVVNFVKQCSQDTWIVEMNKQQYIAKFVVVKHDQQYYGFEKSQTNRGVSYCKPQLFNRLSNIVDLIDDPTTKGYSLQVYDILGGYTLASVIKHRQFYDTPYTEAELLQFASANLQLFKERPHGDISINNYFLHDCEYVLLYTEKCSSDLLGLAQVLLEMIILEPLKSSLYEEIGRLKHPLKRLLKSMVDPESEISTLLDQIPKQFRFQEMKMEGQEKLAKLTTQKMTNIGEYLQESLHKININLRLKNHWIVDLLIKSIESNLSVEVFDSTEPGFEAFIKYLENNFTSYLLKQSNINIIQDILQLYYFKFSNLLNQNQDFIEDILQLQSSLKKCQTQIEIIMKSLISNLKMENLSMQQQNIVLKRRASLIESTEMITPEQRIRVLNTLRKHQSYIKVLESYLRTLYRYNNQYSVLIALKRYFDKNFQFASQEMSAIIEEQIKLVINEPLPVILGQANDLSPSQINFGQYSPTQDDGKTRKQFSVIDYYPQNTKYSQQLLVYQYIQLLIWYDDQNELFQPRFFDFIQYNLDDGLYKRLTQKLYLIMKWATEKYLEPPKCIFGIYINIQNNKWLEQYRSQSNLEYSDDFRYFWTQIMTYSNIAATEENCTILMQGQTKHKGYSLTHKLLQIRLIHHLLVLENYLYPCIKFNQLSHENLVVPEYATKIQSLQDLHNSLEISENAWIHVPGMQQFKVYHLMSICFTFSPKHIENLNTTSNLLDMANLGINVMAYDKNFHYQIMKKAMILQQQDQQIILDETHTRKQRYLNINAYLYISQLKKRSLAKLFIWVQQYLQQDYIQPSIFTLSLLLKMLSCQQMELLAIVIKFIKTCLALSAIVFQNPHEGFEDDIAYFDLIVNKQNLEILAPYDVLLKRKPFKYITDQKLFTQVIIYNCLYDQNYEAIQDLLKGQLTIMKEDQKNKVLYDMLLTMQILFNSISGIDVSDDLNEIHEFTYLEGSLVYTIIQHILTRYHISNYDYESAYQTSMRVMNYIYTYNRTWSVFLQTVNNKQIAFNNNGQFEIIKFISPQMITMQQFEGDTLIGFLYDETFIKEACLNHLDIMTNLDEHIPPANIVFHFLRQINERLQQAYLFKINGKYLSTLATEEGAIKLTKQLLPYAEKQMKKLSKMKIKMRKVQNAKVEAKIVSQTDIDEFNNQMTTLDYEHNVYIAVNKGITISSILASSVQACEKAAYQYQVIARLYRSELHPETPKIQLQLFQNYIQLKQMANALKCLKDAEDQFSNWFMNNKHPSIAYFFYCQSVMKRWIFGQFQICVKDMDSITELTTDEKRYLLRCLFLNDQAVMRLFDDYHIQNDVEQFTLSLKRFLAINVKQITEIPKMEEYETDIVKNMLSLMPNLKFNGLDEALQAYDLFCYFSQDTQFVLLCKTVIDELTQQKMQNKL